MEKHTKVSIAETIHDAQEKVNLFVSQGYKHDDIYVLTHDAEGTDFVSERTETAKIGIAEEGIFSSIADVFRSRGDELRAKIQAFNVSEMEAERLESELDKGKILVLATSSK